ncbi:RES domain-containing protein [Paeniglutamicibacter antarcticus]|uniref:RES domain-containing protein n=1 Tax=Arthrobacter terrae TaxID=2935737 RepID=A0A931CLS8_9MICC|nr:RES domain-containing protein [Arthrobacter terrae]MBG0738810.1 RES domain-containing protein [Arthrobacter terrae]
MSADPGLSDPGDLTGFPATDFEEGEELYRAVAVGQGPWWFGSDGSQRFDLKTPSGTCYTAQNIETSVREKARRPLLAHGVIDPAFVDGINVCELSLQGAGAFAETDSPRSTSFGANRELSTCPDYGLCCSWAEAFKTAGLGGIHYGSRYTTGPANSLAIFGDAGERESWDVVRQLSGHRAMEEAGMLPLIAPRTKRRHANVVEPPPTR